MINKNLILIFVLGFFTIVMSIFLFPQSLQKTTSYKNNFDNQVVSYENNNRGIFQVYKLQLFELNKYAGYFDGYNSLALSHDVEFQKQVTGHEFIVQFSTYQNPISSTSDTTPSFNIYRNNQLIQSYGYDENQKLTFSTNVGDTVKFSSNNDMFTYIHSIEEIKFVNSDSSEDSTPEEISQHQTSIITQVITIINKGYNNIINFFVGLFI